MEQHGSGSKEKNPANIHPANRCRICGAKLYATSQGNYEITYNCSSEQAKFWNFERGTVEQIQAKQHWDESRVEIFINRKEDAPNNSTSN
jgi:hypothetical protein